MRDDSCPVCGVHLMAVWPEDDEWQAAFDATSGSDWFMTIEEIEEVECFRRGDPKWRVPAHKAVECPECHVLLSVAGPIFSLESKRNLVGGREFIAPLVLIERTRGAA